METRDNYRIAKHTSFDEFCEVDEVWYTIEHYSKGLFGRRWKTVTMRVSSGIDVYNQPIRFNEIVEATQLIENLRKGLPHDTVVKEIM